MSYILAQDREGNTHNIKAEAGLSLMEILKGANLDIEAVCGGQCVCSTCHIYVEKKWLEQLTDISEEEQGMVEDTGHYEANSRLACQIIWRDDLAGLALTLAPEF